MKRIKKLIFLSSLLTLFGINNVFSQSVPMKILKIYSFDNIIEQDIKSGISINDVKKMNIQLIEVVSKKYLPIPNVRIFGIKDVNGSSPTDTILFFYKDKLFGILNGFYRYIGDLPEYYFIKDETEYKKEKAIFEELYNKYNIIHNQIIYSLQNKLGLYGKFETIGSESYRESERLIKYISKDLIIILEENYCLLESIAFGVTSSISVFYFNPSLIENIKEKEIIDLFHMYFGIIEKPFIRDVLWEK